MTFEGMLLLFGSEFLKEHDVGRQHDIFKIYGKDAGYWYFAGKIYDEKPYLANLLTQPQTHRAWVNLSPNIIQKAYEERDETESVISFRDSEELGEETV